LWCSLGLLGANIASLGSSCLLWIISEVHYWQYNWQGWISQVLHRQWSYRTLTLHFAHWHCIVLIQWSPHPGSFLAMLVGSCWCQYHQCGKFLSLLNLHGGAFTDSITEEGRKSLQC
jgi:hypothetical protein